MELLLLVTQHAAERPFKSELSLLLALVKAVFAGVSPQDLQNQHKNEQHNNQTAPQQAEKSNGTGQQGQQGRYSSVLEVEGHA